MIENHLPAEKPHINRIPRSIWLLNDSKPPYQRHRPCRIVVHHSYAPTSAQFAGDKTIKAIWNYHVKDKGWADIGYHFLISPDGTTIYDGRPVDAIGAHTGGNPPKCVDRIFGNTGSVGVCLIGNYDAEKPTTAALNTLAMLIVDLCEKWQIDSRQIYGHCEAWSTPPKTCPGKNLFIDLFGVNRWGKCFGKQK